MSKKNWSTKFPFAAIPMRLLPTKELRRKANALWLRRLRGTAARNCMVKPKIFTHASQTTLKLYVSSFHGLQGQTLLSGVFPSTDQYGNGLSGERAARAGKHVAGGWKACFESWVGDWKERSLLTRGPRRIFCNTTTVTLVPMHPGLIRCETTRRIWMRRQLFTKHRGSWCRASIWGVCVGILPTQSFLGLARTCVLHSCGTLSLCLHSVGEVVSLLLPGHSFLLSVWFRLNSQSCRTWRLASMDAGRACTVVTCIL